jgi:hypothetical protein
MLKDTLEVGINTAKILLLGFSIYAVAMLTKPEELQLRQGQLRQWWSGMMSDGQEQVAEPPAKRDPKGEWGF